MVTSILANGISVEILLHGMSPSDAEAHNYTNNFLSKTSLLSVTRTSSNICSAELVRSIIRGQTNEYTARGQVCNIYIYRTLYTICGKTEHGTRTLPFCARIKNRKTGIADTLGGSRLEGKWKRVQWRFRKRGTEKRRPRSFASFCVRTYLFITVLRIIHRPTSNTVWQTGYRRARHCVRAAAAAADAPHVVPREYTNTSRRRDTDV